MAYKEGFLLRTKADAPVNDDGCVLPNGGTGERRDARDDKGDINWLVGFAPGTPPAKLAAGTAVRIPAGSKLVFQMHYSKAAGCCAPQAAMRLIRIRHAAAVARHDARILSGLICLPLPRTTTRAAGDRRQPGI